MASSDKNTELMVEGLDKIAEAARFLKLSTSSVYNLMTCGRLPYVKIGKARRVPHRAVVELAARSLVRGQAR
jgi:excisionase family DNA binding protein